jgi:hypothetical protein
MGEEHNSNGLPPGLEAPFAPEDAVPLSGSVWDEKTELAYEYIGPPPAPTDRPEQAEPPGFRVWTPEEIWAELEPPAYFMDGLLIRGALALIVAYGSSLKTWMAEDAALSVATGEKWLGRFKTEQAEALHIDFEIGDYEVRRRAHRIARGRELATPIPGFAFVSMPALTLASDDFFTTLRPLADRYKFIVIDSLSAASGGIDENDARFAVSLYRLKAIAAETGAVVLVIHHSRKGGGEDTDPREMVRGSSAIFNACDVVLQMTRASEGAFTVRQTKSRGGPAVEPFVVRIEDTPEGGSVMVARDPGQAEAANTSRAMTKAKREALLVLAAEKDLRSKEAVYRRIHGTKTVKLNALAELLEEGLVTLTPEGTYRLTSEVGQ